MIACDAKKVWRRKAVWGAGRSLLVVALAGLLFVGSAVHVAAAQPPTPAAQDEFVPVDPSEQEQLPAAPLVMAAYAIAWLAIFGYLWSVWRRLAKVEREISAVSRRIEGGARR